MKSAAMWFQWHKLYVPWQRKFALPKGYGQWESFQYERDCLIPRYAPSLWARARTSHRASSNSGLCQRQTPLCDGQILTGTMQLWPSCQCLKPIIDGLHFFVFCAYFCPIYHGWILHKPDNPRLCGPHTYSKNEGPNECNIYATA